MHYLKKFTTHANYESYIEGDPALPNVSICDDESHVHYTSKPIVGSLCFTANEASSIQLTQVDTPSSVSLETSVDGKEWTEYTMNNVIMLNANDKVFFRNTSESAVLFSTSTGYYLFIMTGNISVSGDVTTLIKKDGKVSDLSDKHYCFHNLFLNCTTLVSAPILPTLTLSNNCYDSMFKGCTALTTAPIISGQTLNTSCYQHMFENCTSLVNAPELPVNYLRPNCYMGMFAGCTALVDAPTLPGIYLALFCYSGMFEGCTSLQNAPVLSAPAFDVSCYTNMFKNCSSLDHIECLVKEANSYCTFNWVNGVATNGSFIKSASATTWSRDENGIPAGWLVTNRNN